MNKYDKLVSMNDSWLEDRPTMSENNTTQRLLELLKGEVDEAMGEGLDDEELLRELADIGIFLFSIFKQLNADLYDVVAEKMAFNILRYSWQDFQEGDYDEGRKKAKVREIEVKKDFYS